MFIGSKVDRRLKSSRNWVLSVWAMSVYGLGLTLEFNSAVSSLDLLDRIETLRSTGRLFIPWCRLDPTRHAAKYKLWACHGACPKFTGTDGTKGTPRSLTVPRCWVEKGSVTVENHSYFYLPPTPFHFCQQNLFWPRFPFNAGVPPQVPLVTRLRP